MRNKIWLIAELIKNMQQFSRCAKPKQLQKENKKKKKIKVQNHAANLILENL